MQGNESKAPLVYLLILNYKGYDDTCECIDSLLEIQYGNYKLLIIDNDSRDGSEERLRKKYPDIEIIQTHKNLGFAGGNNVGIKYALDRNADYIGILNNDIIVDKNFLNVLVSTMESDKEIGIIGPTVCDYYNRGKIISAGAKMSLLTGEGAYIHVNEDYYSKKTEKIVMCDYISGCCMLARANIIDKIGNLPEVYFMYFEETEWCFKARKKRLKVICDTDSVIWHKESAAIGEASPLKQYYLNRNRVLFIKRNANFFHKLVFYVYILLQMIYRSLAGRKVYWKALYDGYINKIEKVM